MRGPDRSAAAIGIPVAVALIIIMAVIFAFFLILLAEWKCQLPWSLGRRKTAEGVDASAGIITMH